jgi:hypothetical protein
MWPFSYTGWSGILSNSSSLVAKDLPIPGEDWPSWQFRWEVPPAAGYNTYGG